jgi:hypothetical protein
MFDPDDEALRQIAAIEQRVRPTVRLRHGYNAELVEGACITVADLDALLTLARAGVEPREGR